MADMPPEVYPPSEQTYTSGSFPRRLQDALLDLLRRFELSTDIARREYVKNCLKNHELFRGNAWRWWDYQTGTWRAYNSSSGGLSNVASTAEVQSLYSLNIFQGFALAFIALLSGNKMTVKWWPVNSRSPEDMEAAKKRDAVTRWWQANERTHTQLRKALYLLWCDGTIGSYVRTVADADRFGYIEEPQIEIVERTFGAPAYKCVVCGTPNDEAGGCKNCGAPLPDEPNVPAPSARVPVQTGTKKIPKSRTVRDVVGGLELKLPPTCEEIWEFPYLIRSREILASTVKATYPELDDKISGAMSSSGSAAAVTEKRARLQLAHGLTSDGRTLPVKTADYVTFSEVWFRRQAFYELDDKQLRDELVAMFPDGVYVSFAEDQFCEARAENLTEHWAICHALPGEGQIRQPIGGSTVQVQEILNDIFNLLRDHIEYGMPSTFVSNRVLDLRKWARSNVVAGAAYNVESPGNMSLRDSFFQTEPSRLPEFAVGFFNALRTDIPEFTSGVFRAAYGSHDPGNPTAQGMAIARDAALGRVAPILRTLSEHWADVATLVVNDFRKNALEPIAVVSRDQIGDFKTDVLRREDLDIGDAKTFPELDEDYPTTFPQKQSLLLQLMANPLFQPVLTALSNADLIRKTLGHELQIPGEAQYRHAFRTIRDLLGAPPSPGQPQPVIGPDGQTILDPNTGQPAMQPGPPESTVMLDALDDAAVNLMAAIDFAFSEDGERAKAANPDGYQNFLLWVEANQAKIQSGATNALTPPPPPMPPPATPQPPADGNQAQAVQ